MLIVDLLSYHNLIWLILSSIRRVLSHNISTTPTTMALYSTSTVDLATTDCFPCFLRDQIAPNKHAVSWCGCGFPVINTTSPIGITIALNVEMTLLSKDQSFPWCTFKIFENVVHYSHIIFPRIHACNVLPHVLQMKYLDECESNKSTNLPISNTFHVQSPLQQVQLTWPLGQLEKM